MQAHKRGRSPAFFRVSLSPSVDPEEVLPKVLTYSRDTSSRRATLHHWSVRNTVLISFHEQFSGLV